MSDSYESQVKEIIATRLHVEPKRVIGGASFIEDLGADSLDIVELVMAIEECFDLEIPDTEVDNIKTVQNAIDYVAINKKSAD